MNRLMIFLDAIRDHLDAHALPPACSIEVTTWSTPVSVHLDTDTVTGVAHGLSTWAATLDAPRVSLWRSGDRVQLELSGRTPCGIPVTVYGGVPFDPVTFPDLPPRTEQEMPVWLLRDWARGGEAAA
ncbi:hypothetical protein [Amycolatopsis echigonensis]|uniref:Uncharacterized protein n=1 Tax=Amycolatopsis echigonensis TaxID=2576905 RepID=A0A8E1T1C0_9PSEU|nr:hypothetical protein [Amycolatopsis echigonensis]MBB2497627.1 hypothetical protein [Amycolatopsis echigonensis]